MGADLSDPNSELSNTRQAAAIPPEIPIADVFFLKPENQRYVSGGSRRPKSPMTVSGCLILLAFVLISLWMLGALVRDASTWVDTGTLLVTIGMNAAAFIATLIMIRKWQRYKRLAREGRLIRGAVVKTEAVEGDAEDGYGYKVTLHYVFRSPTGHELQGRGSHKRNDLMGKPLPPSGTPILVLYVNDKLHEVL
jgi:hypothetical protein